MQTPEKAVAFYTDKVKGLDSNLQELEKIVQSKSSQLRVVEESKSCQLSTLSFGDCLSGMMTDNAQCFDKRCSAAKVRHRRLLPLPQDRKRLASQSLHGRIPENEINLMPIRCVLDLLLLKNSVGTNCHYIVRRHEISTSPFDSHE